jgi:hypothetical protein
LPEWPSRAEARRAAREMYFERSGSEPVLSLLVDVRLLVVVGFCEEGATGSSEVNGSPAKARGADNFERMVSNVL